MLQILPAPLLGGNLAFRHAIPDPETRAANMPHEHI